MTRTEASRLLKTDCPEVREFHTLRALGLFNNCQVVKSGGVCVSCFHEWISNKEVRL